MLFTIVTGTRPNLVKAAPLIREFEKQGLNYHFIHTGQHYDVTMFRNILKDLEMPKPSCDFGVFTPDTVKRISDIMFEFGKYANYNKPNMVIVFGDVDSSLAIALCANKLKIPLAHIEAGERSGNRSMPEEINRILIDELSDYHFCSSTNALWNLKSIDIKMWTASFGNLMLDQLRHILSTQEEYAVKNEPYGILTLHRQENVDDPEKLKLIMEMVGRISERIIIYFPVHPRTRKQFGPGVKKHHGIIFDTPRLYSEFIRILNNAEFIITDSGGVQVEASYLNIPTITLRNETEWLDTVSNGSNVVIGNTEYLEFDDLKKAIDNILDGKWKQSSFKNMAEYNHNASENIVNILKGLKL